MIFYFVVIGGAVATALLGVWGLAELWARRQIKARHAYLDRRFAERGYEERVHVPF